MSEKLLFDKWVIEASHCFSHFRPNEPASLTRALENRVPQLCAAEVELVLSPMRTGFLVDHAPTPLAIEEGSEKQGDDA